MADRKDIELNGSDEGVNPTPAAPADAQSTASANSKLNGLPDVESPSISPAISEPVAIDEPAIEPKAEPEVEAAQTSPKRTELVRMPAPAAEEPFEPFVAEEPARFAMKPRHLRTMRLAAAVAIGAGIGAIVGTFATGGIGSTPPVNVAAQEEDKAMQQSVAKLTKEVTTLKASLESANKAAQAQVASIDRKIAERINERLKKEAADITGSISAPQTVAAAPAAAAPTVTAPAFAAPLPTPRPAQRMAMAEPQVQQRQTVVRDWSVRGARNGYVFVEGNRGEIYQIVPGAPLPGLGPVESIRRYDGRWVVKTPKGIIVSMRDRRYFE